jgi:hypothetical protein
MKKVTAVHPYWPQALDDLGDVLQYDTKGMKPDAVKRVGALIAALRQKDLAGRTRFLVTEMQWDSPIDEKLDFELRRKRQVEAVQELVKDLAFRTPRKCCVRAKLWPGGSSNNCREVTWCHHTMDVTLADGPGRVGRSRSNPQQRQAGQDRSAPFASNSERRKGRSSLCRWLTGDPDVHASARTLILRAGDRRCSDRRRLCTTLSSACVTPCCSCLSIACSCGSRRG